jgi:hypothetical protein
LPALSASSLYRIQHLDSAGDNGMRALAVSLFVAVPALVSAATAPLRKRISGFATCYYTQTGNPGSCGSYLSDSAFTIAMN